jgi:hypothetical protein
MQKIPSFLFCFLLFFCCSNPRYVLNTDKVSFTQLLDNIVADQNKIHSIQATSRISVDSEEFSGNFFADIIYLNTDSLLLSVSGPFGIHAGKLFIGKNRFLFFNQLSNKFYAGSVSEFRDKKFFQFPLSLSELIDIFAAKESFQAMRVERYDIQNGDFFLNAQNGSISYQIWVDDFSGKIKKISAANGTGVLYIREYNELKKISGIYFPRRISMMRPQNRQAVSIYYTKLQLNEKIDRSKFAITVSDHAEQIDFSNYLPGKEK